MRNVIKSCLILKKTIYWSNLCSFKRNFNINASCCLKSQIGTWFYMPGIQFKIQPTKYLKNYDWGFFISISNFIISKSKYSSAIVKYLLLQVDKSIKSHCPVYCFHVHFYTHTSPIYLFIRRSFRQGSLFLYARCTIVVLSGKSDKINKQSTRYPHYVFISPRRQTNNKIGNGFSG